MKKLNFIISSDNSSSIRKTINWVSVVRFIAIFMVIASHMADNVPMSERTGDLYKSWVPYYGSLLRACVPLFIMLTGYLLLPLGGVNGNKLKNGEVPLLSFYKKRIPRVLIPFIIWTFIFNLFPWFLVSVCKLNPETINIFFAWADPVTMETSFAGGLKTGFFALFFNFNVYNTHMWYIFAVIGIYLYLPIFSTWVENSSLKSKKIFLAIWGITLLVPYLRELNPSVYPEGHYLFGACAWNEFGLLYSFAGFNGYLLLGHLLGEMKTLNWLKTIMITLPLFVAGYVITAIGFKHMLNLEGATELQIEMFYNYFTPNVVAMSVAALVFFKKIGSIPMKNSVSKIFGSINKCSFGIYLIHYVFLGPIYKIAVNWPMPTVIKMTIASILSFVICWVVVGLVKKIRFSNWILG